MGGGSVHFTANYWRFHESDFQERSLFGEVAGTGFADWPIAYADLEPYYTKAEYDLGISGLAGANPFEGAAIEAVSAAANAGEVVGRAVRAGGEEAGAASVIRRRWRFFRSRIRAARLARIAASANSSAARCARNRARWSR